MASRAVTLLAGFRLLFPFLDASGRALLSLLVTQELAQVPADQWTRQVIRRLWRVALVVGDASSHALLRGILEDVDAEISAHDAMKRVPQVFRDITRGSWDKGRQL